MKVNAHLTTNSLNKLLFGVQKIAEKMSQEVASKVANRAQTNFDNAFYDGVNDVTVEFSKTGPRTWEVVARGQSAAFIEFGTGAQAYTPGAYGRRGEQRGWSFKEKEGTRYTADGGPLFTMQDQDPIVKKEYVLNPVTKKPLMKKVRRNGQSVSEPVVKITKIPQEPKQLNRPGYGFTRGNKPNNCMMNAVQSVLDELPKIAREAVKK